METITRLFEKIPLIMSGFLCLTVFVLSSIFLYIYVNINIKGICRIIFENESKYKFPIEPFNYFFISLLPIVFWRELLVKRIKFNFKNIYKKSFYFEMSERKLFKLLKEYPAFFYVQYLIFFSSIFFVILLGSAFVLKKGWQ